MYYVSRGRREAENIIIGKLINQFCSIGLLRNPRIIDVVNDIEKEAIRMYKPDISYVEDYIYERCIIPRIHMLTTHDHHFRVTKEGNVLIELPLLRKNDKGKEEKKKEIQYNLTKDGMEKIHTYDLCRSETERLFKNVRYLYDKNGIEIKRQIKMSEKDGNSERTVDILKERLKEYPNIIKITKKSKSIVEDEEIKYYDIRNSRYLEDLVEKEEDRIEEKDIKKLDRSEKEQIIKRMYPSYKYGMSKLMGIDIEHDVR